MTVSISGNAGAARPRRSVTVSVTRGIWARIEPIVRNTAAIIAFLLLWELAPRFGLINRTFMPPFSEVIVKGAQFAYAGKLLPQIWVSLQRALGGFTLGVVVAVPLGILLGWSKTLEAYLVDFH